MRARLILRGRQGSTREIDLQDLLTAGLRDATRTEGNRWIKRLRQVPYGAETMRTRFRYRGDSLWWFTEIYLHKTRRLERAVAAVLAIDAARERHAPAALTVESDDPIVRHAAAAAGRARGIAVELRGLDRAPAPPSTDSLVRALTARMSRLKPARLSRLARQPAVLAFVHSAFWRGAADPATPQGEHYIGPVLQALAGRLDRRELVCVGVGPRRNFRARRWWDAVLPGSSPIVPIERLAPARALRESHALWKQRRALAAELTAGDAIRDAASYAGVDLWPVLEDELRATAWLQWPWSARAMDEAAAALDALAPGIALTYAEAGGWGRAIVLEARRRHIASVGVQHGFIYGHWLNYLHEPDELQPAGGTAPFPLPTKTLVFDGLTARHLQAAGGFPAAALTIAGNPRLDELTARTAAVDEAGRRRIRQALGADPDRRLALLAAKHSEIGSELPALRQAIAALPDVCLAVKPHPAETPEVYAELRGHGNVTVLPGTADLADLLAAADAIVTMNSTVAVDGLVLGVPAVVVGLPNNLSPFVDAGVMAGAASPAGIREALEAVLYDRDRRQQLLQAARAFAAREGLQSDGHAADRTAEAILALRRSATRSPFTEGA